MKMNREKENAYLPIEDYGIIGNLHTAALVSLYGSIDFMSFPRFDSPTIFCKLLDSDIGGSFSILPLMSNMVTKQLYLPDTNVLVTRFFAGEGIAEVIDYMPIYNEKEGGKLIRRVSTVRGKIRYQMKCAPRFDYARAPHTTSAEDDQVLFKPSNEGQQAMLLRSSVKLSLDGHDAVSEFELHENQSCCFILEEEDKKTMQPVETYADQSFEETIRYWQQWIGQSQYNGHWEEVVRRSALTLKLLICRQYGSMVAAPTFSLPEDVGGKRNWDYRYTWIRDAAFSMHAFLQLGFMNEADHFLQWVKKQSTEKELQLMFNVNGKTDLEENTLDNLEGYRGSQPVRIGNNAHRQTQMDVYGELMETIYIFSMHGGDITYDYWRTIEKYIEFVISNWNKPDHSIWEVRGVKREFLFSRLMCWVALDRAIKIAEKFSFPYDFISWKNQRNAIYKDIYENFWSEEKQSYVQAKGSDNLDASALLMPILNFISPHAERWQKTMDAIDRELRSDVLIYRYREQKDEIDGLKGKEGTFSICSFWYVECLALQGDVEKARVNFEKMLGYANHLGLFAEQIGMRGQHLGNFPQAFTHLALISAAIELSSNGHRKSTHLRHLEKNMK
ncbi:MAG: glycoside hydrolase family 15 protein [Flavisolibacter sp.]